MLFLSLRPCPCCCCLWREERVGVVRPGLLEAFSEFQAPGVLETAPDVAVDTDAGAGVDVADDLVVRRLLLMLLVLLLTLLLLLLLLLLLFGVCGTFDCSCPSA